MPLRLSKWSINFAEKNDCQYLCSQFVFYSHIQYSTWRQLSEEHLDIYTTSMRNVLWASNTISLDVMFDWGTIWGLLNVNACFLKKLCLTHSSRGCRNNPLLLLFPHVHNRPALLEVTPPSLSDWTRLTRHPAPLPDTVCGLMRALCTNASASHILPHYSSNLIHKGATSQSRRCHSRGFVSPLPCTWCTSYHYCSFAVPTKVNNFSSVLLKKCHLRVDMSLNL